MIKYFAMTYTKEQVIDLLKRLSEEIADNVELDCTIDHNYAIEIFLIRGSVNQITDQFVKENLN